MYKIPKRKVAKKKKKENLFLSILSKLFVVGLSVVLAGLIALKVYLMMLPPIKNLEDLKPNMVTQFYSDDGEIIKTFTAFSSSKTTLREVPKPLIQALVATEDKHFFSHPGYDLVGLARSMVANVLAGRVVQGASTLTQQLSRMLFLSNEKTLTRKIKEIKISAQIEKTIDKEKILELYLNNVYLGSGAYGVEAAASIYFNKALKELTLPEMALIAGLPQAPSVYSPFNNLDLAVKRRNQVLGRMYKMKYIDKKTYSEAKKAEVKLSDVPSLYALNKAPYFCDYVMKELLKLGFTEEEISTGGYKIVTTLDYKTQVKTNEAILKIMNAWGLKSDKNQAAVFAFNPIDGRILAYAGGKDYTKSQYDRVTQSLRPSGSAFKPFIYAAGVEKGYGPNDKLDDLPFKVGDWVPRNYGNKYRGSIPIYTALMISSNVCAARMMDIVGVKDVIQLSRVMGITTEMPFDYTISLGSHSVKLFEMTRAYGVFANGGYKVEPYAIERIETSRGKVIYEAPRTKTQKVLDYNTVSIMTAMLKTVIQHGTGVAANIGKPAAGKTGTTDDYKDAYFMGYTPDVVCGVWVGNDDNSKGSLTGGTVPALIWKEIMKVATESYGNRDFDYPPVELEPFKAPSVKVIEPDDAKKAFDKKDGDKIEVPQLDLPKVDVPKINISLPNFRKNEQPIVAPPKPVKEQSAPVPTLQQSSVQIPVTPEKKDVIKTNEIKIDAGNKIMENNVNE